MNNLKNFWLFKICLPILQIVVARFETNTTWASIVILGMEKGNGTTLTRKHNQSEISTDPVSWIKLAPTSHLTLLET